MRNLCLILPLLMLFLTACPNSEEAGDSNGSDIPESVNNLKITLFDGGGMLPVSYDTYISTDSAYWTYYRYRYETRIKWIPNKKEMDNLYQELRKHNFDKITSDCEGEVYDSPCQLKLTERTMTLTIPEIALSKKNGWMITRA